MMTEAPDRIGMAERITWQRQATALLGKLLEHAAKEGLPVISWTVAGLGAGLSGQPYARPYAQRREDFGAWRAALTVLTGQAPDTDHEASTPAGEIRLTAQWDYLRPPVANGVRVTLAASIWADTGEDEG